MNALPPMFELFHTARRHRPSELDSVERHVLLTHLGRWMESWHQASSIDHEAVEDVGALLGASIHEKVDPEVYDWAMRRGGALDHEIAAAVLAGYWRVRAPGIDLLGYAEWLDRLPRTTLSFAAVLHALSTAVRYDRGHMPPQVKRSAVQRLLAARQMLVDTGLHPSVLVDLTELPR